MDIKRLQYFCTIVEQGQITKAAKALNMSQPPLSQRLKEIEDELGVTLILRANKRWWVTEYGNELYRRAKSILNQLENITENFSYSIGDVIGQVQIGATPDCLSYLTAVIPDLAQVYPLISYNLHVVEKQTLESMLRQRQLDIAVTPLPLHTPSCGFTRLPKRRLVAVAPKGFLAHDPKEDLKIQDIENIPLILPNQKSAQGVYETVLQAFQAEGFSPYILIATSDISMQMTLLRHGLQSVIIIPSTELTADDAHAFDVYGLHIEAFKETVALAYLNNAEHSRIIQIVLEAFTGKYLRTG